MAKMREFFILCIKASLRGIWGVVGWVALAVGIILSCIQWYNPAWSVAHISSQMNAFVSGIIPLAAGASLFVIRLLISPYWVYQDGCAKLKDATDEITSLTQNIPKLDVSFDPKDKICMEVNNRQDGSSNHVFHLKLEQYGSCSVKGCKGMLTQIVRNESSVWNGKVDLAFVHHQTGDATKTDIYKNSPEYLDVIFIEYTPDKTFKEVKMGTQGHNWQDWNPTSQIFSAEGIYRFKIQLVGENLRETINVTLTFHFSKELNASIMELITC